jgi:uncharacterized protein YndB with AHSA1/START domain
MAGPDPSTTLSLVRDLEVAPELVFGAFLDAEAMRTIWSSDKFMVVGMSVDARVGGGWQLTMRDEASGAVARNTARYAEIDRPNRIVWWVKWLDGPLAGAPEACVTLEFSAIAAGTRLKLTHEFFPDSVTRDHHGSGWASGLERLAKLLSGKPLN